MKAFVAWLYSTFPNPVDFLPPMLLYLGLWAIVVLVVAVLSWYVWFLVASVLVRIFNRIVDLFFGSLELLSRLTFGKQEIPNPVHPVIQRVVITEDRRYRSERDPEA